MKVARLNGRITQILMANGAVTKDKRMRTPELLTALGLRQDQGRLLRAEVAIEREDAPILSSGDGGYWIPDPATLQGQNEIAECAGTICRKGVKTLQSGRNIARFQNSELDGQLELSEV